MRIAQEWLRTVKSGAKLECGESGKRLVIAIAATVPPVAIVTVAIIIVVIVIVWVAEVDAGSPETEAPSTVPVTTATMPAVMTAKVTGYAIAAEMAAAKVATATSVTAASTAKLGASSVTAASTAMTATSAAVGGVGCRYKGRQRQGCACGGQHAYVSLHVGASLFVVFEPRCDAHFCCANKLFSGSPLMSNVPSVGRLRRIRKSRLTDL